MDDDDRLQRAISDYVVPPPPPDLAGHVAREVSGQATPNAGRRAPLLSRALPGALGLAAGLLIAVAFGAVVGGTRDPAVAPGQRLAGARETVKLGERATLVLEDGAAVTWRSEGGALVIDQTSGAIFYRVERGPVVVKTPQGDVRVLGTCFVVEVSNMKLQKQAVAGAAIGAAIAGLATVAVYEGRVSVASAGRDVELGPGQRAIFDGKDAARRMPMGPPDDGASGAAGVAPALREVALARTAALEIESLRARLAEKESELARVQSTPRDDGSEGPKDLRRFFDPTPEELRTRVERCEIAFQYPNLDAAQPTRVSDGVASKLGLSDTEREIVDDEMRQLHARLPASLREIYGEVSGDPTTASRVSPGSLLGEIIQKTPEGDLVPLRDQLARERAGLATPPADTKAGPPIERALRLMVGLGDDFERRLAERLGPDRARALRPLRNSWRNTSRMSGCEKR